MTKSSLSGINPAPPKSEQPVSAMTCDEKLAFASEMARVKAKVWQDGGRPAMAEDLIHLAGMIDRLRTGSAPS